MPPKISIILPIYNGERYLREALESILAQTFKNFELIVVNDCSTDDTLSIVKSYQIIDSRIKVHTNQTNLKLPKSLNIGHRFAQGEFCTWTSDDNILKPTFLEVFIKASSEGNASIFFSNYDTIEEQGEFLSLERKGPVSGLFFGNSIGASFLYKKDVFEKLNGYNENLFLVEDYDFFLRAASTFGFAHINTSLYSFRVGSESLTAKISMDRVYRLDFENSISTMFKNFGKSFGWRQQSIDLLKDLHLRNAISLNRFLIARSFVLEDLQLACDKMPSAEYKEAKINLDMAFRNNWIANPEDHNLSQLLKVMRYCPGIMCDKSRATSTRKTIQLIRSNLK